jgi:hypothetical protein
MKQCNDKKKKEKNNKDKSKRVYLIDIKKNNGIYCEVFFYMVSKVVLFLKCKKNC